MDPAQPGRRRPCILVDFDGVWTELHGQARAVDEARLRLLQEGSGWSPPRVQQCLDEVANTVRAHPEQHGWRVNGQLAAFADEDPFLMHSALVMGLDHAARAGSTACSQLLRALAARGHANLEALGQEAFHQGCRQYLGAHGHQLRPGAVDALRELLSFANVVFCTNFAADAVERTWTQHGFPTQGSCKTNGLTIRGSARKQALQEPLARTAEFGGRAVCVERPCYQAVLLEERPHVVVGDVFSMDLALPLVLRAEIKEWSGVECMLMQTPFTPAWASILCKGGQPGLRAVESPGHMVEIARRLLVCD